MTDILIIEDEKHIAELERDYLEMSGFTCDLVGTAAAGFNNLREKAYKLIILDLMLPDGNGLDVSKEITELTDIPILMVTAKGDDIEKLTGFSHGAADYIVKPFNPNELIARVRAHISRYERIKKSSIETDELVFGNVTVDRDSRIVTVNNQIVSMTAKEFDLLYFLSANPNRVYTKEDLFEKIWGLDAVGDNTTVTVHIRKIREKIERNPSSPKWIQTVWGVGYKFTKV
ncbi:response regulator transcription factor [Jeotgalicoccus halotolerans]|uniref:response regulator transcription factor n=1 Tax=Jeotgalicoccus halotolerans TaxID=157227 RepID=UPI0035184CB4